MFIATYSNLTDDKFGEEGFQPPKETTMRILGNIDHPNYKITVFQLDHKYAIKFEDNLYEQTFKIRSSPAISGMADLQKLVDEEFLLNVKRRFIRMHSDLGDTFQRNFGEEEEEDFDEIV